MQFEESCNNSGFTKNCLISGHHLDNVVRNICQNIAEGTNYFKVITLFKYAVNCLFKFLRVLVNHFYFQQILGKNS